MGVVRNHTKEKIMPTVPNGPRYNKGFMTALLQAYVLGKKTMLYKNNSYVVKDHMKDAVKDIEDGWYSVVAQPLYTKSNDFDTIELGD